MNSSGGSRFQYVFDSLSELCSWSNCIALCRLARILVLVYCIWVVVGLIWMIHEAVKTLVIEASKGAAASAGYAGMSYVISSYIGYTTPPPEYSKASDFSILKNLDKVPSAFSMVDSRFQIIQLVLCWMLGLILRR